MAKTEQTRRITLFGVAIDAVTMEEALTKAEEGLAKRGALPQVIHTPNAEALTLALADGAYGRLFSDCDLAPPDGAGVLLAAKLQKQPIRTGRIPGIDLLSRLLARCAEGGYTVYLLGGKPNVAAEAKAQLLAKHPALQIVGTHDGYFEPKGEENDAVISEINRRRPDLLVVCLGMPRQEQWMQENRSRLAVGVMGGFGGSLDVYAGKSRRAPNWIRTLSLEWLFRAVKEPFRFRRLRRYPALLLRCAREGRKKAKAE